MLPAAGGRDERLARLLPPDHLTIFDERFIRSCELFEEYVRRLAVSTARALRLPDAAQAPGTAMEIAARAGLDPERAQAPVGWLLATLASAGAATREADGRFRIAAAPDEPDRREVEEAQAAHDPSCLPSYRLADAAAALYPDVLRGGVTGEAALFSPERFSLWAAYFSNDNPIYAVSNRVGALAAERVLPRGGGEVLEIGGGLGSATAALFQRLEETGGSAAVRSYRFTEVAPSFLRRGQRALTALLPGAPLVYGRLDMDRPFSEAGIEPGAVSLVYGVNTLHVARDLECTLGEIRRALAPGGLLVLSECVRPFPGRPIYVEFLFNLLESFRTPRLVDPWRPHGGFLAPEQWKAGLEAGGFRDVAIVPDIARIREICPACVVASLTAVRA
ncbi:MAG TPA: class I SAM-dependent methyltransferase [Candidatus Polarisedimenticolia bacterium]|nr:class I SAM-dependent methyltransferase [Candidatus Polarisedimenticolia bacterium]